MLLAVPKKPMGRETHGEMFFDLLADAIAYRLEQMHYRTKRLLDIEQAAEYLSLSEDAVRDLVSAGKLRAVRPTRKTQFDICDLDDFIQALKSA